MRYTFNYATFDILQEDIAEIIIDQDMEMTEALVDHGQTFLQSRLQAPFGLLVNKLHAYHYTFEAQQMLADLPALKAVAVVTYSSLAQQSAEHLIHIIKHRKLLAIKTFHSRVNALEWLQEALR